MRLTSNSITPISYALAVALVLVLLLFLPQILIALARILYHILQVAIAISVFMGIIVEYYNPGKT
ncbi:hypothetical protein IQ238_17015 [Pleurocapsales cyanobacterium LEGE 06147]|nr:hypothetical protein [Pleurocapsales cyanobacterium LEGE 06147]